MYELRTRADAQAQAAAAKGGELGTAGGRSAAQVAFDELDPGARGQLQYAVGVVGVRVGRADGNELERERSAELKRQWLRCKHAGDQAQSSVAGILKRRARLIGHTGPLRTKGSELSGNRKRA